MRIVSGIPPMASIAERRNTAELMAMKHDFVNNWVKMSPSGRSSYSWALIVVALTSAGIEADGAAVDQAHAFVSESDLLFQFVRQPDIVLIEECQPLS